MTLDNITKSLAVMIHYLDKLIEANAEDLMDEIVRNRCVPESNLFAQTVIKSIMLREIANGGIMWKAPIRDCWSDI